MYLYSCLLAFSFVFSLVPSSSVWAVHLRCLSDFITLQVLLPLPSGAPFTVTPSRSLMWKSCSLTESSHSGEDAHCIVGWYHVFSPQYTYLLGCVARILEADPGSSLAFSSDHQLPSSLPLLRAGEEVEGWAGSGHPVTHCPAQASLPPLRWVTRVFVVDVSLPHTEKAALLGVVDVWTTGLWGHYMDWSLPGPVAPPSPSPCALVCDSTASYPLPFSVASWVLGLLDRRSYKLLGIPARPLPQTHSFHPWTHSRCEYTDIYNPHNWMPHWN